MKKKFECGHSGKGKYCHRCAEPELAKAREEERRRLLVEQQKTWHEQQQAHQLEMRRLKEWEREAIRSREEAQRRRARAERRAQDRLDVIDLSVLDHLPVLQDKVREIIAAMATGASYFYFGGKRLISMNKEILSIPVGNSFRLIYRVNPLTAVEVISHEDYNNKYMK